MAIDYFFRLDTITSPHIFLQDTASRFSLNWISNNLTGSSLLIAAGEFDELDQNFCQEDLGIRPTISVLFNFSRSYTEETYRLMIRICADWITRESGDAMLYMATSGLLFLRKSGVLTIDKDTAEDWWRPARLALMPQPWQRGKLPAY